MIQLSLDWREVLWWMQGGMAGSHLRWSVYEDMVNRVWPQCTEQERRNIWLIMRRDLGTYWRPDGWSGFDLTNAHGEGPWKADDDGYAIDITDADGCPVKAIHDTTPWKHFRQVLARFDPENQYAVTMHVHNQGELDGMLRHTPEGTIIKRPTIPRTEKATGWQSDTATITVRTYGWKDMNGNDAYFIDWSRRCDPERIVEAERLDIPDTGEM